MKTGEKFWQIRNSAETGGHAELVLYGDISRTSWWGDEITPQKFAADLAAIPAEDDLTVRICSGGGDVWAAQAIGGQLESRAGTVTAQIEGLCASAATIIACHCKVVKATPDSSYMIHPVKAKSDNFIGVEELQQLIDSITVMRSTILGQYEKKTGKSNEELAAWMDKTTWWTAEQAKENGFIDEIVEGNQTAKIENRNGVLFVNSVAVPGTFDSAPEFVRNRAVVVPDNDDGFVNNNDPAEPSGENNGGNDMEFKNVDELRNGCPDLVKEIVDSERAAAQKAERERLAAIDEIAETIPANMVAEAKYGENACSAEQLAYRAAVDAKKNHRKLLEDTADDANTSGANSVGGAAPDGVAGTGTKNQNQTDAEKRAMVKNLLHPKKEG